MQAGIIEWFLLFYVKKRRPTSVNVNFATW